MLSYVTGDLFETPAQTLVNTVNTVGVMGKGIALTFKKIYPDMFAAYQQLCVDKRFQVGSLFLWRTPTKLILNFPTKKHWRSPSKLDYIERGLEKFVEIYNYAGIHSVAFPPLGCGNGELDFDDVRPIMERYLLDLPIRSFIYAPLPQAEPPEHRTPEQMKEWLYSEPTALPFSEVWGDLQALLKRRTHFETSKNRVVEAEFVEDKNAIRIRAAGTTVAFRADEIEELWNELRSDLLVSAQGALMKRSRAMSYLLPVLAELPYIDIVGIADSFADLHLSPSYGLQLIPARQGDRTSRTKQLELVG
jgi:O-acetyl-ADP-ribose deacetylase (regulator of RNase III)